MAKVAVIQTIAEVARVPEIWVSASMKKTISRWLQALTATPKARHGHDKTHRRAQTPHQKLPEKEPRKSKLEQDDVSVRKSEQLLLGDAALRSDATKPKKRRMLDIGVKIDYVILVPANNAEGQTGMGALEAVMNAPLGNITGILRAKASKYIGDEAGIQVTNVFQPVLGVGEYYTTVTTTTITTTMILKIAVASAPPRAALHIVVMFSVAFVSWLSNTISHRRS